MINILEIKVDYHKWIRQKIIFIWGISKDKSLKMKYQESILIEINNKKRSVYKYKVANF